MMIHTHDLRRFIDSINLHYDNGIQEKANRSAHQFKKDLMYGLLELERKQPHPIQVSNTQADIMKFDPATGEPKPYPSHAEQYRAYHGSVAWLFNPWTGTRRAAADIGTDVFGRAIV